jgi:Tol biopolymer transport system component
VTNVDGSGIQKLAKMDYNYIDEPCLRWSPDGKRIAFIDYGSMGKDNLFGRDGDQLFVVNSDGTGLQKLASNLTGYTLNCPLKWSPDGSHLLLSAGKNETTTVEGTETHTMVWNVLLTRIDGAPVQDPVQGCCFNWSLDGLQYLYTRGKEGGGEILLQKIAGGGPIQLAQGMTWKWGPSWSLDGTRLVFQCTHTELCFTNPDGSDVRRFSLPDIVDSYVIKQLAWSPDGQQIAFIDWSDKAFLVRADGSGFKPLSEQSICTGTHTGTPQWFPDSQSILCEDYPSEISLVDTRDGSSTPIAEGDNAAISPEGHQIAYEGGQYPNFEVMTVSLDGRSQQNLSNNPQDGVRRKIILSNLGLGFGISTLFILALGLVFMLGVRAIPKLGGRIKKEQTTPRLIILWCLSLLMIIVGGLALFSAPVFERLYPPSNWGDAPGGWTLLIILALFWIAAYLDVVWIVIALPVAWIIASIAFSLDFSILLNPPTFEIGLASLRILNPSILIPFLMISGALLGKKLIGKNLRASIAFAFIGLVLGFACLTVLLVSVG